MLNIAIVEDQKVYYSHLMSMIEKWSERSGTEENERIRPCVDICTSGAALLENIKQGKAYDAVFIDIELETPTSGLELSKTLRNTGYDNVIAFATNHDEYWQEGYLVEAYRFLKKPVKLNDVCDVMDKAQKKHLGSYFRYTFRDVYHNIPYDEIMYLSSAGHYITIYTKDEEHTSKNSLKKIQQLLPDEFVRCHRSYIVNIRFIDKLMGNLLYLTNKTVISVADSYLAIVRREICREF